MIQDTRFIVLGAKTMLELVDLMNKNVHPLAQLKYFGTNVGDYTGYPDEARLKAAIVIAVFDAMPTPIADMGDMQIVMNNGTSGNVSNDMETTMSA